jgi:hypothetical protein
MGWQINDPLVYVDQPIFLNTRPVVAFQPTASGRSLFDLSPPQPALARSTRSVDLNVVRPTRFASIAKKSALQSTTVRAILVSGEQCVLY